MLSRKWSGRGGHISPTLPVVAIVCDLRDLSAAYRRGTATSPDTTSLHRWLIPAIHSPASTAADAAVFQGRFAGQRLHAEGSAAFKHFLQHWQDMILAP